MPFSISAPSSVTKAIVWITACDRGCISWPCRESSPEFRRPSGNRSPAASNLSARSIASSGAVSPSGCRVLIHLMTFVRLPGVAGCQLAGPHVEHRIGHAVEEIDKEFLRRDQRVEGTGQLVDGPVEPATVVHAARHIDHEHDRVGPGPRAEKADPFTRATAPRPSEATASKWPAPVPEPELPASAPSTAGTASTVVVAVFSTSVPFPGSGCANDRAFDQFAVPLFRADTAVERRSVRGRLHRDEQSGQNQQQEQMDHERQPGRIPFRASRHGDRRMRGRNRDRRDSRAGGGRENGRAPCGRQIPFGRCS